jgi:hypothetical protein
MRGSFRRDAKRARRLAWSGISAEAAGPTWWTSMTVRHRALREAFRSAQAMELDDVAPWIAEPVGPYAELPRRALVRPVRRAGHRSPVALVIAG